MFQLLSGKKVVIIGISSGIDLAIAKKNGRNGGKSCTFPLISREIK